ncbi:hypothetical protein NP493_284g02013 [Ridgeia piscesae]|uniref:Ig-like domain-containing protein n=1 Tax=Ridgeia piscesae TaxID=27915 RepID=A0AAD9UCA3_RIDPI|nr:hypothetical protein NP493_284g02013 [Ridgeia piscesae]
MFEGHHIRVLRIGAFSRLEFLQSLTLTQCGIESIEPNAFRGMHYVTMLDLQQNRLTRIQPYTFMGLFALSELLLNKNHIRVVDDFAFNGADLQKLSIEQNPELKNISSKAFDGAKVSRLYLYNSSLSDDSLLALRSLQGSLDELILRGNRRPLTLSPDLFRGFTFDHLNLNDNGISDVAFLQHVSADDLALEGNPVGAIDFSRLPSLKKVRSLRLGSTDFLNLNGSFFDGLARLNQLHVTNNSISTLPESLAPVFSRLKSLFLSGNTLHCNCELRWFRAWLTQHADTVLGDIRCKTPFDVDMKSSAIFGKNMTCAPPRNLSVSHAFTEDGSVALRCSAHGDPAPTVSWFADDGRLLGESPVSADRTRRVTVGVLLMTSRTGLKPGVASYTCIATNMRGNATAELSLDAYSLLSDKSNCVSVSPLSLFTYLAAFSLLGTLGSV